MSKAVLRAFSGLFINISAAWFILAFATPNFSDLSLPDSQLTLLKDLLFGTMFLEIAILVEKRLELEHE